MTKFVWADEERRYKRSVHSAVVAAMHGALACDIHINGRGDRAAHNASASLWSLQRLVIERHRSEVADLRAEIRNLRTQVTKLKNKQEIKPAKSKVFKPKVNGKGKGTRNDK
jgi:hypothetical protein